MAVVISGVLKDGAGKPVAGRTIQLKAKRTSPTVVVNILSSSITGADGSYRIEAEPGYYNVSMLREGLLPIQVGEIYVAPNSAPDTLNAFLDAPKDADLRPEVMKRFEEMLKQAVKLSEKVAKDSQLAETAATDAMNAGKSAQDDALRSELAAQASEHAAGESAEYAKSAGKSAEDADCSHQDAAQAASSAQSSERNAADARDESERNAIRAENAAADSEASAKLATKSEQAASTSTENAATSEQNAAESARLAARYKDAAATSEQNAKDSEDAAAQSAGDSAATLAGALKTKNNLSEFADVSNEVLKQIHGNLKLGAAAQRGVDYGGQSSNESLSVMQTGAYGLGGDAVYMSSQYNKPFLPGMIAKGSGLYKITEITSDRPQGADPRGKAGDLILWQKCQSSDGKISGILIYFVSERYFAMNTFRNGFWSGWSQFDSRAGNILLPLRQSVNGDPDVHSIALLAFCGSPGKKTLQRGDFVQGSLLRHVSLIHSSQNGVKFSFSTESPTIAGGYVSLSGQPSLEISGDEFIVSLFMRIN